MTWKYIVIVAISLSIRPASPFIFSLHAQTIEENPEQEIKTSELEARINREDVTIRYGQVSVSREEKTSGPLVVVGGNAFISGVVEGDLIVLNGSASLYREATVTGDLIVAGGFIYASRQAQITGRRINSAERYKIRLAGDGVYYLSPDRPGGLTFNASVNEWRFNRVRGHEFAVHFGLTPQAPVWFPILNGQAFVPTVRNNHGFLDYAVSIEEPLFSPQSLSLKASGYKITEAADSRFFPSLTGSASAFLFQRDYNNYHLKTGVTVSAIQKLGSAVRLEMAYARDRYFNLPAVSPFTLFNRNDVFRVNPTIDEGRIHSLIWQFSIDTRHENTRPANAWYFDARIEKSMKNMGSDFEFTGYDITLRRYNAWKGHHFDLKARLAGSRRPLPLQRVYVLGAQTGLRGFGDFEYTGDRLFISNMEYRLPFTTLRSESLVSWRLEGLFFLDSGVAFFSKASGRNSVGHPAVQERVYPRVGLGLPNGYDDIRWAAGFGLAVSGRLIDGSITVGQNLHTTRSKPRVQVFLHRDIF